MPRLTDRWFDARFYGDADEQGGFTFRDALGGAQGLWLWCPCGYGKAEYPIEGGRPHAIMVPFANPQNAPFAPPNHGPFSKRTNTHPRWTVAGSSLDDLTITPSIDVGGSGDGGSCWHGFITNGEVR